MAVEIIDDGERAVLYCNTSDVAFGPGMPNREWAQAFCDWLHSDPRKYDVGKLCEKWQEFQVKHFPCKHCGHIITVDEKP